MLSSGILYYLIADHIKILRDRDQLYYGGDSGVVSDTLSTLVCNSFYMDDASLVSAISYTIAAVFLAIGVYWLLQMQKKKSGSITGFILWMAVFIPIMSVEMQHLVLGNKYIIGRTALFLYPLFIIQLTYCLHHIRMNYSSSGSTVMLGMGILFVGSFKQHVNTYKTKDWEYDRHNVWVMEHMLAGIADGEPARVKVSWELIPSFIYYSNTKYKGRFYQIEKREENLYEGQQYDYLYLSSYYTEAEDVSQFGGIFQLDTAFQDVPNYLYKQVADQ